MRHAAPPSLQTAWRARLYKPTINFRPVEIIFSKIPLYTLRVIFCELFAFSIETVV